MSVVGDGTVTPDGDRTCDGGSVCAYSALRGSVLGLTATPAANRRFVGWSGACAGSTPRCTAAILGPTSIGAEFAAALRTLALAPSGSGAIAVSPGPTCPGSCSVSFDHGTAVALTAIPSVGHVLLGWGGDCSGSGPGCALTMTADRAASAIFQPSGRYLSVTIVGDGGVSSVLPDEGASILCGTKCGHEYPAPTAVTLSATPGSAQLLLRSWTGCDDAVGNFCELFLNGEGWPNRAVQATFGAQPPGWFDACAQPGMSRFFATPTDDATQTVDLPFQFQLGDLTFNSYAFSTNGLVTFGAEDSAWMPTPLPRAPDAPTPYGVYAFWDDLETSAGNGVCTAVVGAPGGRKAVVTFSAMDFVGSEPPARLTFSVVLAEGTNTVTVLYSEMSSRGSDRARGTGATIGLQAGAFFDQRGYLEPIVSNGTVFGLQ